MTVRLANEPTATISGPNITTPVAVSVLDAVISLDRAWSPYGHAEITVTLPTSQADIDAIDPRANTRIYINAGAWIMRPDGSYRRQDSRAFDLAIIGRDIDHTAATIRIEAATDEALLQSTGLVATSPDTSPLKDQTSLRTVINDHVLSTTGASLEPGPDADATTFSEVTNLVENPRGIADGAPWQIIMSSTGTAALTYRTNGPWNTSPGETPPAYITTAARALVTEQADDDYMCLVAPAEVTGAKLYTALAYATTGHGSSDRIGLYCAWYDEDDNFITSNGGTYETIPDAGAWTRVTGTFSSPKNARSALVGVRYPTADPPAHVGDTLYCTGVMLVEGDGLDTDTVHELTYFDGDTADDAAYNYKWSDTAAASSSTRTPLVDRSPDVLTWQPGDNPLDFITPTVQAAGMRLFCDESRRWRLVGGDYAVKGRTVVAAGSNLYAGTDTISLTGTDDDGSPTFFDAVVLRYTWTNSNNGSETRYDVAQLTEHPARVHRIDIAAPYPGPGAAAYILAQANGHGRTLAIDSRIDYACTPSMEAAVTFPSTEIQTGVVSSVSWDLGRDVMTVGTAGLVDTPPGAWLLLPPGEAWTDSPAGASWIDEPIGD